MSVEDGDGVGFENVDVAAGRVVDVQTGDVRFESVGSSDTRDGVDDRSASGCVDIQRVEVAGIDDRTSRGVDCHGSV